ncbi:MAG: HAD family phosphatase [Defluviitaleaceae bacterium]|nr:HAD family phosphatase [Defluviitaleaceae bacterium]
MSTKAYIFDLDGTLFDSMGVWLDIDVAFLKKRGIVTPEDFADKISAMTFHEAAVYTIKRFGLPDSAESIMQEWNSMAAFAFENTVQMKTYAKEYLTELRKCGVKLAIATSLNPELYKPALRNHGIYDWFDVICDAIEVGCGKSRPDIFILTARKLGVSPCECIVFEDIIAAIKSAKSAGMMVYGVYDKSSADDWEQIKRIADSVITDFRNAPLPK